MPDYLQYIFSQSNFQRKLCEMEFIENPTQDNIFLENPLERLVKIQGKRLKKPISDIGSLEETKKWQILVNYNRRL